VRASGFEWKGQGTLPRPHFAVANITGIVSAMCHPYSDLVGCPVTHKRTLARYLDAANYPNGNPFASPDDAFADDLFAINEKVRESSDIVESNSPRRSMWRACYCHADGSYATPVRGAIAVTAAAMPARLSRT
jgi:lambda family phage minor tail protein L